MLISGFSAGMFQTNCYVVAPEVGAHAVVIDPGQQAAARVSELLAEHRLTPVAVLLTHGHLDHTWAAADVCDEFDIPAYIHPADRPMLADPAKGLGTALAAVLTGLTFREPTTVVEFADHETLDLAGLRFRVDHAPGHTQGSVLLTLDPGEQTPRADASVPVCFSGDVLFAGSIGRTDLPGGDHQQLLGSIARRVLTRPEETVVLPGHGPQTSIGHERTSNPFLTDLVADADTDSADAIAQKGRFGL